IMRVFIERRVGRAAVVMADGQLNADVADLLGVPDFIQSVANGIAQGDLTIRIGSQQTAIDTPVRFVPAPNGMFAANLGEPPKPGQARDDIARTDDFHVSDNPLSPWALQVTISNPYTYRASTIAAITGLLAATALLALLLAVGVADFLEASAQQLVRLDWLAQNLLELSKLDSGLVLLDLRPDDVRACVESAVQQAEPAAKRRGVSLTMDLPTRPVRIRHDPQRLGQ